MQLTILVLDNNQLEGSLPEAWSNFSSVSPVFWLLGVACGVNHVLRTLVAQNREGEKTNRSTALA